MDYMLKRIKGKKGGLVKLDADVFYKILDKNIYKSLGTVKIRLNRKLLPLGKYVLNNFEGICDHINRDIFDNRRENLRIVNIRQSQLNRIFKNKQFKNFTGIHLQNRGKRIRAAHRFPDGRYISFQCKMSYPGLVLCAIARDKLVIAGGDEDYAPLNFPFFKIPEYKKLLLAADLEKLKDLVNERAKNKNNKKELDSLMLWDFI